MAIGEAKVLRGEAQAEDARLEGCEREARWPVRFVCGVAAHHVHLERHALGIRQGEAHPR